MDLRIFTLPFDPVLEGFPDELIVEFCLNKKVQKLESQFFLQEGRAYWSVAIHYEVLHKEEKLPRLANTASVREGVILRNNTRRETPSRRLIQHLHGDQIALSYFV